MSIIQLHSGGYINLLHPKPEDIHIGDIAHALSNICRFNGQTSHFYSVAQHSVLTSILVEDKSLALSALMHDAAEAYIGDVTSPLKKLLPEYRKIEANLESVIAERFGLSKTKPAAVTKADLIALVTEKRDLMISTDFDADYWSDFSDIKPNPEKIFFQSPEIAKQAFLMRFKRILSQSGLNHDEIQRAALA